jgi:hypothetical protein
MRDLKDLLEPLGDRPMPDRWDEIQHRPVHPMPELHRSRLGAGIAAVAVAILAVGVIVWLSPLGAPHEEPAGYGDPSTWQRYVSPQGWNAALPPGWTGQWFSAPPLPSISGSVISNEPATGGIPPSGDIGSSSFPSTGVALVVGEPGPDKASGEQPVVQVPPLSWSDLHVQQDTKAPDGTDVLHGGGVLFEGPRQVFQATVRIGADASPTDVAAMRDVVESITFDDSSDQVPSPSGTPGLPTQDSVIDGRFVTDVVLDDGAFSVQPAPADAVPAIPQADAEHLLFASPLFQGKANGVLGFGLVTSRVSQHGVSTFESDPAWIAFGWGGTYNCPELTAGAPSPEDLPSSGYVAVALIEGAGGGDISYEARSNPCGTVFGPTVRAATHIESVPWTQSGPITGGSIPISYAPPPCGVPFSTSASGQGSVYTLSVEVEVPDDPGPCPSTAPVTDSVQLSPNGQPITRIEHGPTGIVRQAPF